MHRRCQMDQSSQCCQRVIFEVSLRLIEALGWFVVLTWAGETAAVRTAKGESSIPRKFWAEGEVASIEILWFF